MPRIHDPGRRMRERMARLEAEERARHEARATAERVAETVTLSRARGSEFEMGQAARGGRERPQRRMTGLEWLTLKGRLSSAQRAAGERYGAAFRRAELTPSIPSTLEARPGATADEGLSVADLAHKAQARARAEGRLAHYRRRLREQADLVAACDQVCGAELTPREAAGGDRQGVRLEAALAIALDILAANEPEAA
jgi:hypothetical protein